MVACGVCILVETKSAIITCAKLRHSVIIAMSTVEAAVSLQAQ